MHHLPLVNLYATVTGPLLSRPPALLLSRPPTPSPYFPPSPSPPPHPSPVHSLTSLLSLRPWLQARAKPPSRAYRPPRALGLLRKLQPALWRGQPARGWVQSALPCTVYRRRRVPTKQIILPTRRRLSVTPRCCVTFRSTFGFHSINGQLFNFVIFSHIWWYFYYCIMIANNVTYNGKYRSSYTGAKLNQLHFNQTNFKS